MRLPACLLAILLCSLFLTTPVPCESRQRPNHDHGRGHGKNPHSPHRPHAYSLLCNPRNTPKALRNPELPTCCLPIEALPSGRPRPGSITPRTPFPPWMNLTLVRAGQRFSSKYLFSMGLSCFVGLVAGLVVPDEAAVLAFTGLTADKSSALKRYAATGAQFQVWMEALYKSERGRGRDGGSAKGGRGRGKGRGRQVSRDAALTSLENVRARHAAVARRAAAVGASNLRARPGDPYPFISPHVYDNVTLDEVMWDAIAADFAASDLPRRKWSHAYTKYNPITLPLNQFIQGITLVSFMGYAVINPRSLYIWDATPEDFSAYLHMWAVFGWMLGIEDDFNVALQPDPRTAVKYIRRLNEEYIYPAWAQIDRTGKVLVEAVLNNGNRYLPGVGPRPMMIRIVRDQFRIKTPNLERTFSAGDRLVLENVDRLFGRTSRSAGKRELLNAAMDERINAGVVVFYGPYETFGQKAEHAFYTNITRY